MQKKQISKLTDVILCLSSGCPGFNIPSSMTSEPDPERSPLSLEAKVRRLRRITEDRLWTCLVLEENESSFESCSLEDTSGCPPSLRLSF